MRMSSLLPHDLCHGRSTSLWPPTEDLHISARATHLQKEPLTTREMPSLPAGILNNIKFSSDTINLNAGDMVVMVSDGVLTGDERWLERLIRSWNEGSAQDLAQAVVQEAIRRRAEIKDDDITAVVVRITENQ